jgi:periplasmic protein TonB
MFENMLIDERIRTKRGKTTILSFALQMLLVSVLVLLPLMFTEALPTRMLETTLVAPPPPPPPPPAAAPSAASRQVQQTQVKSELEVPVKIPQKVAMVRESMPNSEAGAAPPSTSGVVGGVAGGVEGGTIGGVMGGVLNSVGNAVPKLAPNRIKVSSGVTQGLITKQVKPEYPPVARRSRIEGTVVLAAVVGKDGKVKDVRVMSGPPMLAQAAERAVRQWQYKPYLLNGQPVEIDTTINVNFKLDA